MSLDFMASVRTNFGITPVITGTSRLFAELTESSNVRLGAEFRYMQDVVTGELSAPLSPDSLRRARGGLRCPSFRLRMSHSSGAESHLAALTNVDLVETETFVLSTPSRSGASYLLAACAIVVVAELTNATIDEPLNYFVNVGTADARRALAALREPVLVAGSLEERSRQRLRHLPGAKSSYWLHEPAG